MRKLLFLVAVAVMSTLVVTAQTRVITGKVTDKNGKPVDNASVQLKGGKTGTSADANGNFKISAQTGDVLIISSVNFATAQVKVGAGSTVTAVLEDKTGVLEDVVVTALGIKRRPKELGYAQTTVKADQITAGQSPTIGQALSGKVAGLTILNENASVNADVKVVLRGYRSITGNNEALIVLDGMPVPQNTLAYINPQDVENVSVLKGGQAATLYGSDGANGVLMITTKKGNVRPQVNFVHSTTIDQVSFFPGQQTEYGSGSDYGGAPLSNDNFRPFENQQYGDAFDGTIRDFGRVLADGSHLQLPYSQVPNQKKNAFNTGYTFTNTISLSGGDERSGRFFMSVQDLQIQGVVPHDEYHRTAFRFNSSRTFGKFHAGFDGTFTSDRTQRTNADFQSLVLNTPGEIPINQFKDWQNNKFANPNGYFNDYYDNPYFAADNQRNDSRNNFFNGSLNIEYKPTNWLSFMYRIGTAITNNVTKNWTGQFLYTTYAAKTAPTFVAKYNDYNGINRALTNVLGNVNDQLSWSSRITSDFIATVDKKFKDFSLKAIAGMSVQVRQSRSSSVSNASLVIPNLYFVNNTAGVLTGSDNSSLQRKFGYYADATVGYKDVAFLHGAVRQDQSSVFFDPSRPTSLYTFLYPGVDASLILTDIFPAMKSTTLNYLKLRGGYNVNKNDNLNPYSLFPTYSAAGGFPYGTTVGLTAGSTYPDANLRPESISTTEAGLEFGLFNNRINLDLSVYQSVSKDLIMSAAVSNTTGYGTYLLNAAGMTTKGIEVDLKASIIKKGNFTWDVSTNYTYNANTVNAISSKLGLSSFQSGSLGTSAYEFATIGNPFPYLKVSGFQRDPNNNAVVVDNGANHIPVKDLNLVNRGNMLPKHIVGFSTNVSYKGFTLATTLEFRTGYWIMSGSGLSSAFSGGGAQTDTYHRKPFVWPNSETFDATTGKYTTNTTAVGDYAAWYLAWGDVGTPSSAANIGEFYATSGQFLKMRDASLSYAIPQGLLKKTKFIRTASITLVGRNLFMLLPKENIYADPEFNAFAINSNNIGLNTTANTPTTRSYGVTLNLGF